MDITLTGLDLAEVTPNGNYLRVELHGVDGDQLLEELSIQDVISHYGVDDLLEEMSVPDVVAYFGEDLLGEFDEETVLNYFGIDKKED